MTFSYYVLASYLLISLELYQTTLCNTSSLLRVLADAEAIRSFYTDHYSHKRERDFTCLGAPFRDVFGECLATSHGRHEVRRWRGPFEKYFSASAVTSALPLIGRECKTFLQNLPTGQPVDLMKQGLANVTLKILIHVVYGEEVLQKYFDKIVTIGKQLEEVIDDFSIGKTLLPFYSLFPTNTNKKSYSFNMLWTEFNQFLFNEYLEERLHANDGFFFIVMENLKQNSLNMSEQEVR